VQQLLVLAVFVSVLAALVGFGFGLRALALSKNHPDAPSLKLIALNLLEPSVTMLVLFVAFVVMGGEELLDDMNFLLPAMGLISLTWMLLAPLWTRVTHPIRGTLIAHGLLRWLNTIAFWYFGIRALTESQSNDLAMLAAGFIASGTLILILSVAHLAGSLGEFRPTTLSPTTLSPTTLSPTSP
jgi:hypothetical protein